MGRKGREEREILALRTGAGPVVFAAITGRPASTIGKVLRRWGCSRLPRPERDPLRRRLGAMAGALETRRRLHATCAAATQCSQRVEDDGEVDRFLEEGSCDRREVSGAATAMAARLSPIPASTLCRANGVTVGRSPSIAGALGAVTGVLLD